MLLEDNFEDEQKKKIRYGFSNGVEYFQPVTMTLHAAIGTPLR